MSTRAAFLALVALLSACRFKLDRTLAEGEVRGSVVLAGVSDVVVPVPGATVRLESSGQMARTDEQGRFSLRGVTAGRWSLRIRKATEAGELGLRVDGIDLGEREASSGGIDLGRLVIGQPGRWEGRVTRGGTGVAAARVVLERVGETPADVSGRFAFEELPPGRYDVAVVLPGGEGVVRLSPVIVPLGGTLASDLVLDGYVPEKTGDLSGYAWLSGRRDHAGIRVRVEGGRPDSPAARGVETDADGSYDLGTLEAGVYSLVATADGHHAAQVPFTVVVGPNVARPMLLVPLDGRCGADGASDGDDDGDGVPDDQEPEACRCAEGSKDADRDGTCDHADRDLDADGVDDAVDNCRGLANAGQEDADRDGQGDACEPLPTCTDGLSNGAESDVDCGGTCAPCLDGSTCLSGADCETGVCSGGACQPARCDDGVANGGETGADCGGPCGDCDVAEACAGAGDCASGVCASGRCAAPGCADGVANGDEAGVDCGGPCAPCGAGGCVEAADCASGVCAGGACVAAACDDGVANGGEAGVDCGGPCGPCGAAVRCTDDAACASGLCALGSCVDELFETLVDRDVDTLVASSPVRLAFAGAALLWTEGEGAPELSTDGGRTWGAVREAEGGADVLARMTTSSSFLTSRVATVHLGDRVATWTVTTRAEDGLSGGASFRPVEGVLPSSRVGTEARQLTEFTDVTSVEVSGDGAPRLRIDAGPWSTRGLVVPGQRLQLAVTAADTFQTARTVRALVGGVERTWTVTTAPPPTAASTGAPGARASFLPLEDVAPGARVTSNEAFLGPFPGPLDAFVSGTSGAPLLSVDGGGWAASGAVLPGSGVRLEVTAPSAFARAAGVVLQVGAGSSLWTVRTVAQDVEPVPFGFPAVWRADPGAAVGSAPASIRGITGRLRVRLEADAGDPQVRVNGGAWAPAPGEPLPTVGDGDALEVRVTSATAPGASRSVLVRVGLGRATFRVVTAAPPVAVGPGAAGRFDIPPVEDAEPGDWAYSAPLAFEGFGDASFRLAGRGSPEASVDGGLTWAASGRLVPGGEVRLRLVTSTAFETARAATLSLDGASPAAGTFTVTTRAADRRPEGLAFAAVAESATGTVVVSEVARLEGFDGRLAVSVAGGGDPEVSVNGGAWARSSWVRAGQSIAVRLTSAAGPLATRVATVSVGDAQASFAVTTREVPVPPAPLAFAAAVDVEPGALVASDAHVPAGQPGPGTVSVSGPGEPRVSVAGGPWLSSASWSPGEAVVVRAQASAAFSTTTRATVRLGAASGGFTVRTRAARRVPVGLAFAAASGLAPGSGPRESGIATLTDFDGELEVAIRGDGAPEFRIDGGAWTAGPAGVRAGQTLQLRANAPAAEGTTGVAAVTVGATVAEWSLTTLTLDRMPDPFAFAERLDLEPSTAYDSEIVTLTGFEVPVAVSAAAREPVSFRIDGGPLVGAGSVAPGGTLQLQGSTGPDFDTAYPVTVTVGGGTATWQLRTRARDERPDGLSFATVSGAAPGAVVTSAPAVLTDFDGPMLATVTGGELSVSGEPWATSAPVEPGDTLVLRVTASSTRGASAEARVTVGSVVADFVVITLPYDTTPDPFDFTDVLDAETGRLVVSDTVTIAGVDTDVPVAVRGDASAELSINGGPFAPTGVISPGQTLRLRLLTPAAEGTSTVLFCTVGSVTVDWLVNTAGQDTVPDVFDFADVADAAPEAHVVSEAVTLGGFSGMLTARPQAPSAAFELSTDDGATWEPSVLVGPGSTLRLRLTTTAARGEASVARLSLGGAVVDWQVTNRALGPLDAITVGPLTGATAVEQTSNPATLPAWVGSVQLTSVTADPPSALAPKLLLGVAQTPAAVGTTVPSGSEVRLAVLPVVGSVPHAVVATLTGGLTITWSFTPAVGDPSAASGACSPGRCDFSGAGAAQAFVVPAGASTLTIKTWGGGGGNYGGAGGFTQVTVDLAAAGVAAGSALYVQAGMGGNYGCGTTLAAGAYPGGGRSGRNVFATSCAGAGGGYTAVYLGGAPDPARLVSIAGGGGGGSGASNSTRGTLGGGGGGASGQTGNTYGSNGRPGLGGTQTAGGARGVNPLSTYGDGAAGASLAGGAGGDNTYRGGGGGGGGGGWFGGGGAASNNDLGAGAGGGSGRVGTLPGISGTTAMSTNQTVAGQADADYVAGTGAGGARVGRGGNGRVVIRW